MATCVRLVGTGGSLSGREFVFTGRTLCIMGRDPECRLCLRGEPPDRTVSRRHCLLDIDPPHVWVFDLGSRNGTFVNGEKLGGRDRATDLVPPGVPLEAQLRDGDELSIGQSRFRVAIGPVRQAVPTPDEPVVEAEWDRPSWSDRERTGKTPAGISG